MSDYKIKNKPATIFRTVKDKDNPYVMIDRRPIENTSLSFKSKGILIYLLSRPDGWEVNMIDLVSRSTEGLASVKSGVKELQIAGHLRHITIKDKKTGRVTAHVWEVYEIPQIEIRILDNSPVEELHHKVKNHNVEKPQCGKSPTSIKYLSNKELNLTSSSTTADEQTKKPSLPDEPVQEPIQPITTQYLPEGQFAEKAFREITGMTTFPGGGSGQAINAIESLRSKYPTVPEMVAYLKPFYVEWIRRTYSKANLAWLIDWAVSGEIPRLREPRKSNRTPTPGLAAGESLAEHNARVIKEVVDARQPR